MDTDCVKWIAACLVLSCGALEIFCPGVTELDSTGRLNVTGVIGGSYFPPFGRNAVATCTEHGCESKMPGYVANLTSDSGSYLEIMNVQLKDHGTWKYNDLSSYSECRLNLSKTPTCHITSGNDTNNLDIHENISLSVNVANYYCSTPIDFLLQAGDTEEVLIKPTTVDEKTITSDVFNSTFNVTESHIGSMELIFICNNVSKAVQCGGVQTLWKRPPMCNITADGDAGGLDVGDEITMYVYIEDYSCSGDLEFFLQTGGETYRRNVTGKYKESVTFTVEESHFGSVYLGMNCNDVSRNLTCNGIQDLSKRQHTTTTTPFDNCGQRNGPIIVTGIIAGVAFTIAISILIWYLVMLRRKSSGKLSGLKDVPYADVSDNINARPKSIRFDGAYAEVTDTNGTFSIKGYDKDSKPEIQMVPNPGYESVDDVREELSQSRKSKVQNSDISDIYSKVNKNRMSSASVDGFC